MSRKHLGNTSCTEGRRELRERHTKEGYFEVATVRTSDVNSR